MIELYTKHNCQPCKATKRFLNKHDIKYNETIITSENVEQLKQQTGQTQAPIIITTTGETWSGYNPTKLQQLKEDN